MDKVAAWLATDEGLLWLTRRFTDDATDYHDIIEIVDDLDPDVMIDHLFISSDAMLQRAKEDQPIWADLTWTPDQSP